MELGCDPKLIHGIVLYMPISCPWSDMSFPQIVKFKQSPFQDKYANDKYILYITKNFNNMITPINLSAPIYCIIKKFDIVLSEKGEYFVIAKFDVDPKISNILKIIRDECPYNYLPWFRTRDYVLVGSTTHEPLARAMCEKLTKLFVGELIKFDEPKTYQLKN
nr:hypothetical protein [Abalone asfa-like virus]